MFMADELKSCPFCGGEAEIRLHRYHGTGASGMETPEPYAACKSGCVAMNPVPADDWPYGQAHGANTSEQARAIVIAAWNTRAPSQPLSDDVVERALFHELLKRGIDEDAADQTAQAVVAAIPPAGGVEELREELIEARNSLNGIRFGQRVDLTGAIERIDAVLESTGK